MYVGLRKKGNMYVALLFEAGVHLCPQKLKLEGCMWDWPHDLLNLVLPKKLLLAKVHQHTWGSSGHRRLKSRHLTGKLNKLSKLSKLRQPMFTHPSAAKRTSRSTNTRNANARLEKGGG